MLTYGSIFMIHQLKQEGLSISEIARRLNVDRKTVRRYLATGLEPPAYSQRPPVVSCLDPYKDYLQERLSAFPRLSAKRLLREIGELGYGGGYTVLTDYLRSIRPEEPQPYERRFETSAGDQAQVDFARFIVQFECDPEHERIVWLFSMVLGCSRYLFAQFHWRQTLDTVVRCHVEAFSEFGGTPRQCLYDRMKTAVIGEPEPGHIVYHPTLVSLGNHYGFKAKACKAYRAKTKGKVERPFRYIRQDFFLGRRFYDMEDLNAQLSQWRAEVANRREHGTTKQYIHEAFAAEQTRLQPLPAGPFNDVLLAERRVTRDGMVSVDGNLYSVPEVGHRRKAVNIERTATELRIYDSQQLLTIHPLLKGKHQQQVLPGHRPVRHLSTEHASPNDDQNIIRRDGDEIHQRDLDVYESIGTALASETEVVK